MVSKRQKRDAEYKETRQAAKVHNFLTMVDRRARSKGVKPNPMLDSWEEPGQLRPQTRSFTHKFKKKILRYTVETPIGSQ